MLVKRVTHIIFKALRKRFFKFLRRSQMTKIKDDYIVGLDIGTDSCGWVAMNSDNDILKLQGKTAIGSHLFEAGKSAV